MTVTPSAAGRRQSSVAPAPVRTTTRGSLLGELLRTTDHKMIDKMYLVTAFGFFLAARLMIETAAHRIDDRRPATCAPAARPAGATLEEQLVVATAGVTSILTSRIDPQDEVAVRARDAALMALAVIDAAMDRIDHGRYGICGRGGGPIAIERLNAPHSRTLYRLPAAKGAMTADGDMSPIPCRMSGPA